MNKLRIIVTGGRWLTSSSFFLCLFLPLVFAFHPLHDLIEASSGHELGFALLIHEIGEYVGLIEPGCDSLKDTLETHHSMLSPHPCILFCSLYCIGDLLQ